MEGRGIPPAVGSDDLPELRPALASSWPGRGVFSFGEVHQEQGEQHERCACQRNGADII
jgi:hypothetical protein